MAASYNNRRLQSSDVDIVLEDLLRTNPEVVLDARRQFEDRLRRFYNQRNIGNDKLNRRRIQPGMIAVDDDQQEEPPLQFFSGNNDNNSTNDDLVPNYMIDLTSRHMNVDWRCQHIKNDDHVDRFHENESYRASAFPDNQNYLASMSTANNSTPDDRFSYQHSSSNTHCHASLSPNTSLNNAFSSIRSSHQFDTTRYPVNDHLSALQRSADLIQSSLNDLYHQSSSSAIEPESTRNSFTTERRLTPTQIARVKELLEELLRTLSATSTEDNSSNSHLPSSCYPNDDIRRPDATLLSSSVLNLERNGDRRFVASENGVESVSSDEDVDGRMLTSEMNGVLSYKSEFIDDVHRTRISNDLKHSTRIPAKTVISSRHRRNESTGESITYQRHVRHHHLGESGLSRDKAENSKRSSDRMSRHGSSHRESPPYWNKKRKRNNDYIPSSSSFASQSDRYNSVTTYSHMCRLCKRSTHTTEQCVYARHRK